jgi:MFS transporter, DHA1 family, multidrug resistance protein
MIDATTRACPGEQLERSYVATAPSTGTTVRRVRFVLILGALSAFGPLSIDLYLPGLPELAHDLDAKAWEGQLTLTACITGLAIGQLLAGPLSDRLGRRRPLLVGLFAYCAASLACAFAPSIFALVALRLVQGFAGAAGIVIARAVVRDLRSGAAAARVFSLLLLVTGLAPTLAPILGGQLLRITSWRGLFVVLAAIVFAMLLGTAAGLPETLPRERRNRAGWRETSRTFHELSRDRVFMGYALVLGISFGEMFAYISGSPFVLQDVYGVSAQLFSVIFAVNALGLVACGQINAALVGRVSPERLLAAGLAVGALSGVSLLAVVLVGGVGLAGILPCLFAMVSSIGFVLPNSAALALVEYPHVAGSASALLGVLQFCIGAAVAPLVGVAGANSAVPMGIVVATLGLASAGAMIATRWSTPRHHEAAAAAIVSGSPVALSDDEG